MSENVSDTTDELRERLDALAERLSTIRAALPRSVFDDFVNQTFPPWRPQSSAAWANVDVQYLSRLFVEFEKTARGLALAETFGPDAAKKPARSKASATS